MSTETVTSWMERINKFIESYSLENVWNIDKSGCFSKALPDKGFVETGKQVKGRKKLKQRLTVSFLLIQLGKRSTNPLPTVKE